MIRQNPPLGKPSPSIDFLASFNSNLSKRRKVGGRLNGPAPGRQRASPTRSGKLPASDSGCPAAGTAHKFLIIHDGAATGTDSRICGGVPLRRRTPGTGSAAGRPNCPARPPSSGRRNSGTYAGWRKRSRYSPDSRATWSGRRRAICPATRTARGPGSVWRDRPGRTKTLTCRSNNWNGWPISPKKGSG